VKGGGFSFDVASAEGAGWEREIAGVGGMEAGLAGFVDLAGGGGCLPYEGFGVGCVEVDA
jgi:hypothetical protein